MATDCIPQVTFEFHDKLKPVVVQFELMAPGIPDLYQGTELWNFSVVDPDNRRPVDYDVRRRLLHELPGLSPEDIWQRRQEGLPKLWIIRQALRVRHERPQVFGPQGHYSPPYARGEKSSHVVSFMRGGEVIVIAPRLFLSLKEGWHQTVIEAPARLMHEYSGVGTTKAGRKSCKHS